MLWAFREHVLVKKAPFLKILFHMIFYLISFIAAPPFIHLIFVLLCILFHHNIKLNVFNIELQQVFQFFITILSIFCPNRILFHEYAFSVKNCVHGGLLLKLADLENFTNDIFFSVVDQSFMEIIFTFKLNHVGELTSLEEQGKYII